MLKKDKLEDDYFYYKIIFQIAKSLFFLLKLIGVTLVDKIIQVSSVQFYDTSSVHLIVCPPPNIKIILLGSFNLVPKIYMMARLKCLSSNVIDPII